MSKKDRKVQQQKLDELKGIREAAERGADRIEKQSGSRKVDRVISVLLLTIAAAGLYLAESGNQRLARSISDALGNIPARLSPEVTSPFAVSDSLKELTKTADPASLKGVIDVSDLLRLGNVKQQQGNLELAIDFYNTAAELADMGHNRQFKAMALCNRGYVRDLQGMSDSAIADFEAALALDRQSHDSIGIANDLRGLGVVYRMLKNPDDAERYARLALDVDRAIGHQAGIAADLCNLGAALCEIGLRDTTFFDSALVVLQESLSRFRTLRRAKPIADVFHNIAQCYCGKNEADSALCYYDLALNMSVAMGDLWGEAVTRCNMGIIYLLTGDCRSGRLHLLRSKEMMDKYGYVDQIGSLEFGLNYIDSVCGNESP